MRGETKTHRSDGAWRAENREGSTLIQERERRILREWSKGRLTFGTGEQKLEKTREDVLEGWRAVSARLKADGEHELGARVDSFLAHMPPAKTEKTLRIEHSRTPTRTR